MITIVTSFSGRLFRFAGGRMLVDTGKVYPNIPMMIYHENSFESNWQKSGHVVSDKKILERKPNNTKIYDLFEETDSVNKYLKDFNEKIKFIGEDDKYFRWKFHSQYWFRKIATISDAMDKCTTPIMLWLDCDCMMKAKFEPDFLKYVSEHDITFWNRGFVTRKATDTGIIFFNLENPEVKEFIKHWESFYHNGRVFDFKRWDDCQTFDYTRGIQCALSRKTDTDTSYDHDEKAFRDLKYGKLSRGYESDGVGYKLWYTKDTADMQPPAKFKCRYLNHWKGKSDTKNLNRVRAGI